MLSFVFTTLLMQGVAALPVAHAAQSAAEAKAVAAGTVHQVRRAGMATARALTFQPPPAEPVPAEAMGCAELYYRIRAAERRTWRTEPGFWRDPRTRAVVALGSVSTPLYYTLGYAAALRYADHERRLGALGTLDALRAQAAREDCFVRH